MAAAARLAARFFPGQATSGTSSSAFGQDQLNWILGLNPFDACMLHGKGRNNPAYMFFDSYEYTNAPGGIVNGITAGYKDESGYRFQPAFRRDRKGRRLEVGGAVAAPRRLVPLRRVPGGLRDRRVREREALMKTKYSWA